MTTINLATGDIITGMRTSFAAVIVATSAFVFLAGCQEPATDAPKPGETAKVETPTKVEPTPDTTKADPAKAAPTGDVDSQGLANKPKDGDDVAVLDTSKGKIVAMFLPDRAPITVTNFKDLAKAKFFDGTRFHRCIAGFMIQGGDPYSKDLSKAGDWGTGGRMVNGTEQFVKDEFNSTQHKKGIMSMANASRVDSGSSQFFIMTDDHPDLDGKYSAFGKVLSGQDVVDQIVLTGSPIPQENGKVDPEKAIVLKSVRIAKWPVK